ncbi:hypothetical protein M422DRAFT_29997 [Sphaerobolus stellatus SS14]|uniref:Acid phosphatase n=1 Tax=Sphaerobolus stellatus (strain SS14) TaxID=990650 RepID=A0A0C9VRU1_SPHS4|nr:hypothetical protein M422DRAFT_29997 [Sphaerobolus stellatus SS14]
MNAPMPRLFVIRHGETEWSLNGKHTGRTDLPLTAHGEEIIRQHAKNITCASGFLDNRNIGFVFVSPRQRAHKTFHLLFEHCAACMPEHTVTEDVREWDYGEYEGITTDEIHKTLPEWDIFRDGCPGGESPEDITKRVDGIIKNIREIHRKYREEGVGKRDVLVVAHGHFTRVLIARWLEAPITLGAHFNVEAAGVAVLSYNHHSLAEPCLDGLNLFAH